MVPRCGDHGEPTGCLGHLGIDFIYQSHGGSRIVPVNTRAPPGLQQFDLLPIVLRVRGKHYSGTASSQSSAVIKSHELAHKDCSSLNNGLQFSHSNFEAQDCLPGQDGSSSGARSNEATSSSSVIMSTKRVKRSLEDSDRFQDLVDVNGDYQIAKPERKNGRLQRPYSKCSQSYRKASNRDRHIMSARDLNMLRRKCPKPYCLFEGARSDVVTRHLRERGHKNESGQGL